LFRLSKLTDYGIVLAAQIAQDELGAASRSAAPHNARELAERTDLPAPAVSKVLKQLAREGVLESHRGIKGGYTLARPAHEISVAEMIRALEGPVAITECAVGQQLCDHETVCNVRGPWQLINAVVRDSLSGITLADLVDPDFTGRGVATPLRILGQGGTAPPRPAKTTASPRAGD